MKGRNATPLVGWHPSADLVTWLDTEVERRGGGWGVRSAILEEALSEYIASRSSNYPLAAPRAVTTRKPSRPAAALTVPFTAAEDEPEPARKNCKHPKVHVKGVCPDCHDYVKGK